MRRDSTWKQPSPGPLAASRPGVAVVFERFLRRLVRVLRLLACIALMVMVLITTLEVVLRAWGYSMKGAYDLVKIAAAITMAAALPYTTAIKGHVAIEYFFHRLGRRGRVGVDALMRLLGMGLFSVLAWGCFEYGNRLKQSGEVSLTLQVPVFWVPYILAASCALVVLIKLYHLFHPGQSLIKP